jgi:hypothetical protein
LDAEDIIVEYDVIILLQLGDWRGASPLNKPCMDGSWWYEQIMKCVPDFSVGIFWRSASKILLAQVLCWRNFTSKTAPAKFKMRQQNLRCASKIINPIFVILREETRCVTCKNVPIELILRI